MPRTPREPVTVGRQHDDVWGQTVGKAPLDDEDSWTFDELKHAMWRWLNFDNEEHEQYLIERLETSVPCVEPAHESMPAIDADEVGVPA
jgi:hypothetical protein